MVRLFLLFSLLVLLTFTNLGLNAIWQPNEAFYAETAREILVNNDWLNLTYNGQPRLEKPPLTYWLTAASYKALGVSELSTRIVPFLSALLTALLLIFYGRKLKSWRFGLAAAIVWLSALQVFALARYDAPEMPLTFFLSASLVFLHLYDLARGVKRKLYLLLSGVFLSLALLTKGIPFVAIYLGGWFFYLLLKGLVEENFSLKGLIKSFIPPLLVSIVASLLVLGWYYYAYLHYGELFVKVFYSEVIHRALNEQKPLQPLFYLAVILWAFFPFSLHFYYGLIGLTFRLRRDYSYLTFPLAWTIAVLLAFTAAKGKIPVYILPAFPAMALLTARLEGLEHPAVRVLNAVVLTLSAFLFLFGVYYFGFYKEPALWAVFILSLLLWFSLPSSQIVKGAVAIAPFMFLLVYSVLPFAERYRPYKPLFEFLNKNYPQSEYKLVCYKRFYKNFPFYRRAIVPKIDTLEELKKYRTAKVLLFSPKKLKGWRVVKEVKLYTRSESRFVNFLRDIKKGKHFKSFYFLVKTSSGQQR